VAHTDGRGHCAVRRRSVWGRRCEGESSQKPGAARQRSIRPVMKERSGGRRGGGALAWRGGVVGHKHPPILHLGGMTTRALEPHLQAPGQLASLEWAASSEVLGRGVRGMGDGRRGTTGEGGGRSDVHDDEGLRASLPLPGRQPLAEQKTVWVGTLTWVWLKKRGI